MIIKLKRVRYADTKKVSKFLWIPLYHDYKIYWLEKVSIEYYAQRGYRFLDFTFAEYHWAVSSVTIE